MVSFQVIMSIFNTILTPCIAITIISPQCFSYALIENAPLISNEYLLPTCKTVFLVPNTTILECVDYLYYPQYILFSSPFLYTYQCSDALLTSYAAVFVYYFLMTTFLPPIRNILCVYFMWYWKQKDHDYIHRIQSSL